MSTTHVYLKPFIDDAGSGYVADWIEVSKDVSELGTLTQALDNTEYEVGVFRASNVKLSLLNHHGYYSDVGNVDTIFKYTRARSLVKITWEPGNHPLIAGFFNADDPDAIASEEITVFEGLLDDVGTQQKIDDADVDFQVLGYEALLNELVVPYSSIANGDSQAAAIYAMLNQSPFNARVTVALANISTGAAATIDDKSDLENKTVLEALKQILVATSSVLWIENNVVYVAPRTASSTVAYTFYGQGAIDGIENIVSIDQYRSGVNKIRNFWTWKDTTLAVGDTSSRNKYGTQKREIDLPIITDTTKRTTLLTACKDEFANQKREMLLEGFVDVNTLALFLLDRVVVDYPSVALPNENNPLAVYEIGEYDQDYYAEELIPLTIESSARFKIMTRQIDFKKETVKFQLREI